MHNRDINVCNKIIKRCGKLEKITKKKNMIGNNKEQ